MTPCPRTCNSLSHLLRASYVLGEVITLRLLDVTQETEELLEIFRADLREQGAVVIELDGGLFGFLEEPQ